MKLPTRNSRHRFGFSLFEVLMFLAVLGVILGISVPLFSQNDAIYAARDRRNAQELSSTSMMAQAAGLDFVQGEDVIETIRAVVRGGMPVQGAMKGRLFVVPGLSEEDIKGAAKYLQIVDGELRYTSSEKALQPGDQKM
jgi:competence protein ComGC